jgi:hypothetical protein
MLTAYTYPTLAATMASQTFVECKTLKDYHIIVSNRLERKVGTHLMKLWVGLDYFDNYSKTLSILAKNNVSDDHKKDILKQLHSFCFPELYARYHDYYIQSFDVPVFNAFRETNIGVTKELDNSVVWKSFQSLSSCIEAYEDLIWEGIDYYLYDVEREDLINDESLVLELTASLLSKATYIAYIQPVLVVESNLWEATGTNVRKLKFFRLIFQKLFENEVWIDVVNKEYLQEYLNKANQYKTFLKSKKFRTVV